MSKQEALYDVHQEHAEWISKLNFYKDDIKIFNTRLEEIVSKNNGEEVLAEVERFQNQFIIQRNNIFIWIFNIKKFFYIKNSY